MTYRRLFLFMPLILCMTLCLSSCGSTKGSSGQQALGENIVSGVGSTAKTEMVDVAITSILTAPATTEGVPMSVELKVTNTTDQPIPSPPPVKSVWFRLTDPAGNLYITKFGGMEPFDNNRPSGLNQEIAPNQTANGNIYFVVPPDWNEMTLLIIKGQYIQPPEVTIGEIRFAPQDTRPVAP